MGETSRGISRAARFGPWLFPAAVVLIAALAAWPALAEPGLLNTRGGGDSPFLLQRLHQLTAALAGGHFPARWMPDAAYGDGYPFYNFYAPLSIYIAAAFRCLGFSFVRAIHLAQLAGFVVAGLGMFYLARRWLGSPWAGLLAAVAYTVAPFHMVNVYVRGDSLAEFWAMAFYPLVLLAADELRIRNYELGIRNERSDERADSRLTTTNDQRLASFRPLARPVALFALAYAALILSHNISALIFSPFLLLYLVLSYLRGGSEAEGSGGAGEQGGKSAVDDGSSSPLHPRSPAPLRLSPAVVGLLSAVVLSLALAAFFFIPALAEQDLAQLGPVTEGYFHFSNHFRGLDLAQGTLLFDYNPDGGQAFRMGLAQAALAGAGVAVLLWGAGRRGQTMDDRRPPAAESDSGRGPSAVGRQPSAVFWFLLAAFALATFMITPLSRPLWEHLPLLSFAQFPWRFLSVQALFGALLTGALAVGAQGARGAGESTPAPLRPRSPARWISILASTLLLASALLALRTDHLTLTDADVTAERLAQYEWFTGNIGTTIRAEYLTPAATPRPWTSAWLNSGQRDRATGIDGNLRAATLLSRAATRQTWALEAGPGGASVLLPALHWPGWRATLDGLPVALSAQPGSGLMTVSVPEGLHTLALELGRTPARAAAEWVSLAALVVTLGLLLWGARRRHWRALGGSLAVIAALVVALAVLWRSDPTDLPPDDLTWDFAQMAYLHHDRDGVAFEDGARLLSYTYSTEVATAGETVTITLHVRPGDGRAATLALVTPAAARPTPDDTAAAPTLVATTQPLAVEMLVFTLPIPADAPPGLYLPRLMLDGARPLLPSGGVRGDLYLRPIRVVTSDVRRATSDRGETTDDVFDVRATALTLRDTTTLDGHFAWTTGRPLGARYQFSWRVQDAAGATLAQLDTQPGYGFQPSTLWLAGAWTADWLALRLPTAPADGDYPLVMRLYDPAGGQTVLTRRVGVLTWADGAWQAGPHVPSFTLPDGLAPAEVTFGGDGSPLIALRGYELAREVDVLRLTLTWQALTGAPGDFTRFVHLLDASGAIVAQADGAPAADSYPTGQWLSGEVVADALTFDLSALPPGAYRLATGFYSPTGGLPRLSAAAPSGHLPDGRFLLPDTIIAE